MAYSRRVGTRAWVWVLGAALIAVPGCLGDIDDGTSDGMAGAGSTPATGGENQGTGASATGGLGGLGSGGDTSGGQAAGGDAGAQATGGLGGEAGFGGAPPSYPADAFVTVWRTGFGDWDEYFAPVTGERTARLPLVEGGTYDFVVDWGDGTTSEVTSATDDDREHHYAKVGTYVLVIRGLIEGWGFEKVFWYEDYGDMHYMRDTLKLREIRQWGTFRFGDFPEAFAHCRYLTVTATDVPDLTPPVTLRRAFQGCESVTEVPSIEDWDISQVSDLAGMFSGAEAFNGDVSAWDTSNVTDMSDLFHWAHAFNGDLSDWDTSSVTDMSYMFRHAGPLSGNISTWDTSSVTDMSGMFMSAEEFNGDLSSWDVGSLTNADAMLYGAGLSRANYDALLIGWAAQNTQDNVTFGTHIRYSAAAANARAVLTEDRGWYIYDGGLAP